MTERKIGEVFEYEGQNFKTVQSNDGCDGCIFEDKNCLLGGIKGTRGQCVDNNRSDVIDVIFQLVKPEHINDITNPEFPEPQMNYEL